MLCFRLGITSEQFWVYGWWNRHGDFTTFWMAIVSLLHVKYVKWFFKKKKNQKKQKIILLMPLTYII